MPYAYQLGIIEGVGDYKGMLQFDLLAEKKEDANKLMSVYSNRYNAKRWGETTMVISDTMERRWLRSTFTLKQKRKKIEKK